MLPSKPYTVHQYSNRAEWLDGRSNGIGASEAAVVLGVSKWQSPFALWARKRGIVGPSDQTEQQRWGLLMEGAIAQWFAEETGFTLSEENTSGCVLKSVRWPFMGCTLDRWIVPGLAGIEFDGIDGTFYEPFPLELKVCDAMVAHEWKKEPPLSYNIQLQYQMAITGAPVACIAVCVGAKEGRWFPVVRNDKFIARMIPRVQAFWQSVVDGVRPDVDGHETTRLALQEMFAPPQVGKRIEIPQPLLAVVEQFDAATSMLAIAKERKEDAANRIRLAMEDAEVAECPGGSGFTWKQDRGGKRSLKRVDKVPKELSEVME